MHITVRSLLQWISARSRKKAIGELGMKYPSEDQIQTYTTEGNSYVRQYQDVDTHK